MIWETVPIVPGHSGKGWMNRLIGILAVVGQLGCYSTHESESRYLPYCGDRLGSVDAEWVVCGRVSAHMHLIGLAWVPKGVAYPVHETSVGVLNSPLGSHVAVDNRGCYSLEVDQEGRYPIEVRMGAESLGVISATAERTSNDLNCEANFELQFSSGIVGNMPKYVEPTSCVYLYLVGSSGALEFLDGTRSDSSGEYWFAGLRPGRYTIAVAEGACDGKQSARLFYPGVNDSGAAETFVLGANRVVEVENNWRSLDSLR